ncbi:MAG TPA: energy-coupling factor transporter transmembrane component T [Solirubrobacteraceae bacterium]|nr:energy-coupling factor transporter transmembrane component T [Solirubrobacteraceae bacterium]
MIYRRRPSPLHSARAASGSGWCAALAIAALAVSNPVFLIAVLVAVVAGGALAGVGRELGRGLRWALPAALAITIVNALVTTDGLTVIWRFGNLPVLGYRYVTAEATVYGAILGLRAVILILCGILYTTCVDPDELLMMFRRVSYRSALSATLATRLVPLLGRDARRLADAQRCRPGPPPSRAALLRAATSNVLDRALDVAAALEVRGYAHARGRAGSGGLRTWSRHDLAFMASALAVATLAIGGRLAGLVGFDAYPMVSIATGVGTGALSLAVIVCALAPFADRRGIVR